MPDPTPLIPLTGPDAPTYVVAGNNHVTILVHRDQTDGVLDAIDVLADPGGGPPPHRHSFVEWFRVLEGELSLCEEHDGVIRPTRRLNPGDSVFVAPWVWHGTLNLSDAPCRFQVVGQPGLMSGYFVEAGVQVAAANAAPDREPPGPPQLRELAPRFGIEFWTGPVQR